MRIAMRAPTLHERPPLQSEGRRLTVRCSGLLRGRVTPRSSRPRQDCETAVAWGAVDPPVPLVATGSFARGTRKHGNLHAVDE
jgi:hypothetical protein